jgi:hypothetical protein
MLLAWSRVLTSIKINSVAADSVRRGIGHLPPMGNRERPSPGAATQGGARRWELTKHHPATDVSVPETGTVRSAGRGTFGFYEGPPWCSMIIDESDTSVDDDDV